MHKAREHQQPLCMCFVDVKKAFDSISHDKLWVTMIETGISSAPDWRAGQIVQKTAR